MFCSLLPPPLVPVGPFPFQSLDLKRAEGVGSGRSGGGSFGVALLFASTAQPVGQNPAPAFPRPSWLSSVQFIAVETGCCGHKVGVGVGFGASEERMKERLFAVCSLRNKAFQAKQTAIPAVAERAADNVSLKGCHSPLFHWASGSASLAHKGAFKVFSFLGIHEWKQMSGETPPHPCSDDLCSSWRPVSC